MGVYCFYHTVSVLQMIGISTSVHKSQNSNVTNLFSFVLQHSDEVKKVYDALIERIDNYEPEPVIEPEPMDTDPLMSVPAPTPAHP